LDVEIRALEKQAYLVLHFETAGRYYRQGDIANAQEHLAQAAVLGTTIEVNWVLDWVAGTALDPRTSNPQAFIDLVFENLPSQLSFLSAHRDRAQAQYHAAAAFAAHQSRHYTNARRHARAALAGNLRLLLNRGFLRILADTHVGTRLWN